MTFVLPKLKHFLNFDVILPKFPSLAALEVVILTTSSAVSDGNFGKMTAFRAGDSASDKSLTDTEWLSRKLPVLRHQRGH